MAALTLLALVWLLARGGSSSSSSSGLGSQHGRGGRGRGMASHVPAGTPPTVIVTVLDTVRFGAKYMDLVKENRRLYADKHGMFLPLPHWISLVVRGKGRNEEGLEGSLTERRREREKGRVEGAKR